MPQNYGSRAKGYFSRLNDALKNLPIDQIGQLADLILETSRARGTIWIAGNGGSASTASHMAVDLSFGVKPVGSIRALSIAESSASITATGNDVAFEEIFSRHIHSLAKPGDLIVLISASGNSPNLLLAAQAATDAGAKTAAILGFNGGQLVDKVQLAVVTPTEIGDYGVAEDLHLAVNHCLKELLSNVE